MVMLAMTAAPAQSRPDLVFRRVLDGTDVPSSLLVVSPDGRRIAYIQSGNLFVRDLAKGTVRQLSSWQGDERATSLPVWSADSSRIALSTTNRTAVVVSGVSKGAIRTIFRAGAGAVIIPKGWSPDGSKLLAWTQAGEERRFAWLTQSGSTLQSIPARTAPENAAAISPDGQFIAYVGRVAAGTVGQLVVMTSDGSRETGSSNELGDAQLCGWLPDGRHLLLLRGSTLWAVSLLNGQIEGAPVMVNRNLGTGLHGAPTTTPAGITRAGTFFYSRYQATSDIYVASIDPATGLVSSSPRPLALSRPGDNVLPRWSPDGKRILYHWVQWAPADNIVYSLETNREERVASHVASASICWTQGGAAILAIPYVGGQSPYQGLVQINLQTGESIPLAPPSSTMIPLNCAGNTVTLATTDALRVFDFVRKSETVLYRYSVPTNTRPSLSHDARLVATVTQIVPGTTALLVVPTTGGEARELVRLKEPEQFQQTFFGFAWSPDDRFVYYLKRRDGESPFELYRVTATGGPEQNLGLRFPALRDIDISPDGTKIAFSVGDPIHGEVWAIENVLSAAPR